jgi:serine/threonine-protein kinase
LCGRLPFDGRSLPALLQQHTEATVPPLRLSESPSRGPTPTRSFLKNGKETRAAAAVDAFMQRALAKRPEDRFSSAREMADAFGEALRTDGLWQEGSTTRKQLFESLAKPYVELSMGGHTQRYDLREGPVVLGRHEYAQFVVPSSRVSRQHACVFLQRGRAWIADLASQNGTNAHGKHVAEGVPAPLTTDGELNMLRLYDMDLCARFVDGHA